MLRKSYLKNRQRLHLFSQTQNIRYFTYSFLHATNQFTMLIHSILNKQFTFTLFCYCTYYKTILLHKIICCCHITKEYDAQESKWYIRPTSDRMTNKGYAFSSSPPPVKRVQECTVWSVGTGGKGFQIQEAVTVSVVGRINLDEIGWLLEYGAEWIAQSEMLLLIQPFAHSWDVKNVLETCHVLIKGYR